MKKYLLISVIMNCYNVEKYLKESIKSLLLQTYKNWELIFWDKNSRENSKNIVKRLEDTRIKYYLKFMGV
jgi:glycosyltransferase involved in cell wall biosynthesis